AGMCHCLTFLPPFVLLFFFTTRPRPRSTLFPYTTLFRSLASTLMFAGLAAVVSLERTFRRYRLFGRFWRADWPRFRALLRLGLRSEEHTSELQSRENLVCRLLLEKKKIAPLPEPADQEHH